MFNVLQAQFDNHPATEPGEAQRRDGYNAAFAQLGLTWHWDATTYAHLQAQGGDPVRRYLERNMAHLLRAYDADFLVQAVEAARARCRAGTGMDPCGSSRFGARAGGAAQRLVA